MTIFRWTARRCFGHIGPVTLCSALFASLLGVMPAPVGAGSISAIDLAGDQLVLRFSGRVAGVSAVPLAAPHRLAIDIEGAEAAARVEPRNRATAVVAGVRQGQFTPETARIVLDLTGPALPASARFSADGRSLTVALKDVDARSFSAAVAQGRSPLAAPELHFARPPRKTHSITVPIPAASRQIDLPRIYGPADSARPLVVIDAGHGGVDPGAGNKRHGIAEKTVTLAIAKAIRDELVASGRVRVALTREDDRFLVLQERYGVARRMNADLFISVHADAAENGEARGATVYTLSETASDREAARLAARENKADIINGVNLGGQSSDVSSILIDLTQRETMNLSSNFAQLLQREASPFIPFRPGYHRYASLVVLKAPDMPSVLFETAYLSNDEDAQMLASRAGQRRIAKGVARAIEVHFARRLALR